MWGQLGLRRARWPRERRPPTYWPLAASRGPSHAPIGAPPSPRCQHRPPARGPSDGRGAPA
eukprot:5763742-Alexandrium_andersonii.AAC.1